MKANLALAGVVLLGVVVRYPFWVEALRTPVDGDTAIVGLMARHPLRDTALWGQPYGSPVDAWLVAPFGLALGFSSDTLRLVYFLLGLLLVPLAGLLAAELDPRARVPAALLLAAPSPYLLLLAALPPPLYPTALVLAALVLLLTLRAGRALAAGARARGALAALGALAGLALWTHLMTGAVVAAAALHLMLKAPRRRLLLAAAVPLVLASGPLWWRALADPQGTRAVALADRDETSLAHLAEVLPRLHEPLGGLVGTHVPVIADDARHVVRPPGWVAAGLVGLYGMALVLAAGRARLGEPAGLLLTSVALTLVAFPFPLRSGPATIRFLTPLYLPLAALVVWAPLARSRDAAAGVRRAFILALALAALHLVAGLALLAAWRSTSRSDPPFQLPDLAPVLEALEARGIQRAYASYAPAYRMTFESGERIVASQPWNERFRHYPLPYLDEVRFAKNVAWVLTPGIPTDLPGPAAFEAALAVAGGGFRRAQVGPAVIYHAFAPPFGVEVVPPPAGPRALADGDLGSDLRPAPGESLTVELPEPLALDAVTLVAPSQPRLLRSFDLLASPDGVAFALVASRRRRQERHDLRWVNGHPQYVLEHDLLAVPLGGQPVKALRVVPVAAADAWALAELLLHPARPPAERRPWDEWLSPELPWAARRERLRAAPQPGREDWYYRSLLAARN